jgi:hypothetical protein
MAKKKTAETAKIKAGPVLRTAGQDPTKTKSYCVRDDWKDINKVNYVAFKSVDGEVQDLTVNGEPAGGGGSSDFSVAHITIKDPGEAGGMLTGPFIVDGTPWSAQFPNTPAIGTEVYSDDGGTEWIADVVLYKGVAIVKLNVDIMTNSTASGNITKDGSYLKITGDGVINVVAE